MPSLVQRIRRFLRSREGQQALERGRRLARDPRTQAKVRRFRDRLNRR